MLQHRATKVLRYLLERPREVISRQDLIDNVWESAHIPDASVTEAIKQLRRTLGDDSAEPTYIQTIQRRGCRFIVPIKEDVLPPATAAPGSPPTRAGKSPFWDARLQMATTLVLAIVLLVVVLAH